MMSKKQKIGKLKIFFGYCAGVGKTYEMLQEAQQKNVEGVDVVVGYIEPHERKETTDLIYGLERLQVREQQYKGKVLYEFDIDAALQRHPQLLLVDELAHTNIPYSRHEKRYSDVEELLRAGIDVYTTVNVQHVESLHDIVEGITGIKVHERIPDHIFDHADDVKLMDIEVDELIKRLMDGKIYKQQKIESALEHFFIADNLIALRAIALRRCAERVNAITSAQKRVYTKEHILVCVGVSPTNEKVLRTASRMAQAFHAEFTALFVETEQMAQLSKKEVAQLQSNLKLARHLGAAIVSTYGEDIIYQICQYAKTGSVSKVVLGRSYQKPSIFHRRTLVDQLTLAAPDLEIYIIPDMHVKAPKNSFVIRKYPHVSMRDILITCSIVLLTTLFGFFMYTISDNPTNVILLFVLAACFIGANTNHPLCSILGALYSILVINYFFITPRFTFHIASSQYTLIFLSLLTVSLTISFFMRRLKKEKRLISLHAHSLDVLLETSQKLQSCRTYHDIMIETCYQLYRMLKKHILYYEVKDKKLEEPYLYGENIEEIHRKRYTSSTEKNVAKWVLQNNKNAGRTTSTLPNAAALYLAIRKNDDIFAVIAIALQEGEELPPYEKGLLKAILNEVALALDSMQLQKHYEETLLRSQWLAAMDQEEI